MQAFKRIVRYVQGTLDHGLHLYPSTVSTLISYTDADWGGCPDTRRSTSGYCVFLDDNVLSWSTKRQPPYLALALRLNTVGWQMLFQNPVGYGMSCCSFIVLYTKLHWFTVTMSVPSISLRILFNINAVKTLKWIFTLCVKKWPATKFVYYMSLPAIRLLIFSLKVCLQYYLRIFGII